MSLVLYSSSEDDDDDNYEKERNVKRIKLPPVNIQLKNEIDLREKEPETKTDRTRLFAHERGNWALSIYTFGKNFQYFLYKNKKLLYCSSFS